MIDNKSNTIPSVLREIPTRNSLHESLDAVVDPLDDDDDDCNSTKPLMLHPTLVEGTAAQLPYQLELAAITAVIECMKKQNEENPINPNRMMHLISDSQHAELSVALARLEKPPVLPQLADLHIPDTAPMIDSAMADSLPAAEDDDDVLHLPVTTPMTASIAPTNDSAMADLPPAADDDISRPLVTAPTTTPNMTDPLANNDGTHPHDKQ